jgi:hypothetical protein
MLKKVAAFGLVAALALSPLAALAQTDTTPAAGASAPADTSMPAKPMKHKTHKAKKHTAKKSMEPAAPAEAAPKS